MNQNYLVLEELEVNALTFILVVFNFLGAQHAFALFCRRLDIFHALFDIDTERLAVQTVHVLFVSDSVHDQGIQAVVVLEIFLDL